MYVIHSVWHCVRPLDFFTTPPIPHVFTAKLAGGEMVYSTCTLNAHENEEAVARILSLYPCLELLPQTPRLGSPVWRNVATLLSPSGP